ncbi:hypothetical protein RchiOBHm_Chr2g0086601 [Rosa chinensis]|uniref:Uncharacterized protein n=1 Tax=Rosa chinensis TaxID=74649 RepID=A0A2P6RIH6_ROSCH|nr:hypothetical protein RchiOBHm_Chr2g0086601 [Rosa chinensis]
MTTFGASGMMFQRVFEGSLSMQDTEIERRPYHKNCNCALHKSKRGACSDACPQQRNISFPKKQSWTDGSLCMSATTSKSSTPPGTTSMSIGNIESLNGVQSLSHR